jgi:hypothetical protein
MRTLENSLLDRGGRLASDADDTSIVTVLRNIRERHTLPPQDATSPNRHDPDATPEPDRMVSDIITLRSADPRVIRRLLSREEGLPGALVPHVIPLLAVEPLADYALFALVKVAEEHVGQLTDAMMDPNHQVAVRRRLARVLSGCVSQRAAEGLLIALDDDRFDVRVQAARSLSAVIVRNDHLSIDPERIYEIVLREVMVGRPVWEGRRLLNGSVSASPLDEFVRDRAGHSLAHVFTLLSLVLPREPLQVAFRSLQSDDTYLRGTALEYLEGVIPPRVRHALWPFLVRRHQAAVSGRQEERLASLLRSSQSVTLQGAAALWDRRARGAVQAFR